MTPPVPGSYVMTGTVQGVRRATQDDCSQLQAIDLCENIVTIEKVHQFKTRWVAKCSFRKQLLARVNEYGQKKWSDDWVIYEFAITDQTDIAMRRLYRYPSGE